MFCELINYRLIQNIVIIFFFCIIEVFEVEDFQGLFQFRYCVFFILKQKRKVKCKIEFFVYFKIEINLFQVLFFQIWVIMFSMQVVFCIKVIDKVGQQRLKFSYCLVYRVRYFSQFREGRIYLCAMCIKMLCVSCSFF